MRCSNKTATLIVQSVKTLAKLVFFLSRAEVCPKQFCGNDSRDLA